MNFALAKRKSSKFLVAIIFLHFAVYATAFLDIPIARQIVGFFYFSFVPGFVIVKLLRINELDRLETIVFSVGLSIAFLMFAGLLINEFGYLLGFSEPLSLIPLIVILNSLTLVGGIIVHLKSENVKLFDFKTKLFPRALILTVFPLFAILGAMLVNAYGDSRVLLVLLLAISVLFIAGLFSRKYLPPELYPLAVLMIACALLLSSSLISQYVVSFGSDIQSEYLILKTAQNSAHWNSATSFAGDTRLQRLNSMLSITILPTIYSNLLNMDATWVFKILFSLILALVPLVLYQVWKIHVGRKYAFISAFFFMAEATFYSEIPGLARQMVGELFFALLLLVVLNKKIKNSNKVTCFIIFSAALVTSHYTLAEIFLFFIFLTSIVLLVMKRPSRNIKVGMVLLFFVLMFTWYIFTSNSSAYNALVSYADYVISQQSEFLNPASRGETVLRGLGVESAPSIWNTISRVFAYFTQALIIIGFVGLVTKRIKIQVEKQYMVLSVIAVIFLGAVILVPGLAKTMNMSRFYHILLFFLAPLGIMGGGVLVGFMSKRKQEPAVSILLLIVLVPYFLFQTGFVYELAGSDSWSLPLSLHRMDAYRLHRSIGYIYSQDVFSAYWVSANVNVQNAKIYADKSSQANILMSHSMIYPDYVNILSNTTRVPVAGIVYLNWLNIAKGTVAGTYDTWNTSELSPIFDTMNKIYSNGASEIYENGSLQIAGS